MLLEMGFSYDQESKVIGRADSLTEKFHVLGVSASRVTYSGSHGGLVRELYTFSHDRCRPVEMGMDTFRTHLGMAFRAASAGGSVDQAIAAWLDDINPYFEETQHGHPVIERGVAVRFYHPDGPEGSWVWKDTVNSVKVIMKR